MPYWIRTTPIACSLLLCALAGKAVAQDSWEPAPAPTTTPLPSGEQQPPAPGALPPDQQQPAPSSTVPQNQVAAPATASPNPAPPPSPAAAAPPPGNDPSWLGPPPPPSRKKGLMIAGLATFGGTYLFTVLVGLTMMSGSANEPGTTCTNCDSVGPKLLIPVVGPWLAIPDSKPGSGPPVCAALGLAQATGVVLSIVGISVYASSGAPETAARRVLPRPMFAVTPVSNGALGVMQGTF